MSILRVAWDNTLAGRDKAGTGIYAAGLLEQFAIRDDLHMKVLHGWRSSSSAKAMLNRGLRTVGNLVWTHGCLPALLWRMDADLLHAPAFIPPIIAPCPVVITIHDITYLLYPSHFPRWVVEYFKAVMPQAMRSAAAIICVSEHSKREVIKIYGVPARKVHAVPNGVDHRRFKPGEALDRNWAQSLGIRDPYLLHVGTFSYRKNIPALLHGIALLRSKGKWRNRQLVLAGSQDLPLKGGNEVFETIQELKLSSTVVLTGHVPDQHVPGLYANASVLVMPSLYEGFGLPILEAMAAGIPVISSNTSSLPEVAGDAALFFPPSDHHALADAIEDLLDHPSLAEQLRHKGLEQARRFSWQRAAEQTVAVYRAVARSSSAG